MRVAAGVADGIVEGAEPVELKESANAASRAWVPIEPDLVTRSRQRFAAWLGAGRVEFHAGIDFAQRVFAAERGEAL